MDGSCTQDAIKADQAAALPAAESQVQGIPGAKGRCGGIKTELSRCLKVFCFQAECLQALLLQGVITPWRRLIARAEASSLVTQQEISHGCSAAFCRQ